MKGKREITVEVNKTVAEDKLFNFRPLFFIGLSVCSGVAFAFFHSFYSISYWWLTALLPVLGAPFFFCRTRKRIKWTALALLTLVLFFFVGYWAFCLQINDYASATEYSGAHVVCGRVVERREYEQSTRVVLDEVVIDGNEEEGKLIAYLPTSYKENIRLCDKLVLTGTVETDVEPFNEYGFYAEKIDDNLRFEMEVESYGISGRDFDLFLVLRERLISVTYAGMDEASAAFTVATLTGDTSGIEQGLLDNVRKGGIAHIFAVSGLHVGALYAFFLLLFSKTRLRKLPRLVRFFLLVSILLFYGGLCGYSASVIRATILCLVLYVTKQIGIDLDGANALGLAAVVVLLVSPVSLFMVGFQLSFLACLGIMWFSRHIYKLVYAVGRGLHHCFVKEKRSKESESDSHPLTVVQRIIRASVSFLSVTLSAQIATAPVLISTFGYFSVWSLLLNCIFVPVISACFSVLLLFVVIASLLPIAWSGVVLYLPSVVWGIIVFAFEVIDFSVALQNVYIGGSALVLYYVSLLFFTDKWNVTNRARLIVSIACLLAFGVAVYAMNC